MQLVEVEQLQVGAFAQLDALGRLSVMAFNGAMTDLYVGASIGSTPFSAASATSYYQNRLQPTQSKAGFAFERNGAGCIMMESFEVTAALERVACVRGNQ